MRVLAVILLSLALAAYAAPDPSALSPSTPTPWCGWGYSMNLTVPAHSRVSNPFYGVGSGPIQPVSCFQASVQAQVQADGLPSIPKLRYFLGCSSEPVAMGEVFLLAELAAVVANPVPVTYLCPLAGRSKGWSIWIDNESDQPAAVAYQLGSN